MDGLTLAGVLLAAMSAVSVGIYRHFVEDRLPWVNTALSVLAAGGILVFGTWAVMQAPDLLLFFIAALIGLSLLNGFVSTSSRLPSEAAHLNVWAEPTANLARMGWVYVGTWHLQLGGKWPEVTIYDRPDGRARAIALGTASPGGIVEVQTLLDGGQGLLTTLNKRSRLIRPLWHFKQTLRGADLVEMTMAHEEALSYLAAMGITGTTNRPEHPIEAIRREHEMFRQHFKQRWWLFAIQPLVTYLSPSRSRRLHEQTDIERQIERYRDSVTSKVP